MVLSTGRGRSKQCVGHDEGSYASSCMAPGPAVEALCEEGKVLGAHRHEGVRWGMPELTGVVEAHCPHRAVVCRQAQEQLFDRSPVQLLYMSTVQCCDPGLLDSVQTQQVAGPVCSNPTNPPSAVTFGAVHSDRERASIGSDLQAQRCAPLPQQWH